MASLLGLLWSGQAGPVGREQGWGKAAWHTLGCPGSWPRLWGSRVGLQRGDSRFGLLLCSRGSLQLFSCHLCCIARTNVQLCRVWGRMVQRFSFIGFVCRLLLVGLIYSRSQQGQGWVGAKVESLFCCILTSSGVRHFFAVLLSV